MSIAIRSIGVPNPLASSAVTDLYNTHLHSAEMIVQGHTVRTVTLQEARGLLTDYHATHPEFELDFGQVEFAADGHGNVPLSFRHLVYNQPYGSYGFDTTGEHFRYYLEHAGDIMRRQKEQGVVAFYGAASKLASAQSILDRWNEFVRFHNDHMREHEFVVNPEFPSDIVTLHLLHHLLNVRFNGGEGFMN